MAAFRFSSLDGSDLILVKTGDPVDAFVPNDTPKSGDLGRIFLTSDFKDDNMTSNVLMSFGSAVTSTMFDIVDIDGLTNTNNAEVFTFDFLLNGASVFTKVVTSGDAGTGDAVVTTISYSSLFDAVEISNGTVGTSTRNIGWGLDNIMTTPVPLPAGVWLMGTALAGFGVASRRRRKAS
ncbi:VPLPA-CTERM sorting domain-containing protein [Tropicimonas sp. IMCC6043]|uniref:VPLPA-CTERM sorting domain-containing protein n=1 Tax=Tropicimonas sp. IMCC6043 TaxID=2510645 RepID=UPI0013ECA998|nr:VPLPA-CTERM sorting domain-containing protein [Tropicimonas sp. IMCC6043]